jgi:hypothetical protein
MTYRVNQYHNVIFLGLTPRSFREPAAAALSAAARGRPGPIGRAFAMRLRPAHHDRGRDGRRRKGLAARSGEADALFHPRSPAEKRGAGPLAGAAAFAGPDARGSLRLTGQNAVLNFFAREFSEIAAGLERDPGGAAGTERGAEHRARANRGSHHLGRAMV